MVREEGVRFTLFGGLRAFKDGKEVELPDKTAGTYLRLLLLSGGVSINNGDGRRLGTSESIRSLVDKANRPFGQFGHYDFKGQTGLEIRFRENVGVVLEGGSWSSDIIEFEELWRRRSTASTNDLRRTLDESEQGLTIESWPKNQVFNDNFTWIRQRVAELQAMGEDLVREIQARSVATERGQVEESNRLPALKDETKSQDEISGSTKGQVESKDSIKSSASMGEELRDLQGAPHGKEPTNATKPPETWHSDVPLLNWIRENGVGDYDQKKLTHIRSTYGCSDDEKLKILEYAYGYGTRMLECDPKRAGGLFVEPAFSRLKRNLKDRFLVGMIEISDNYSPDLQAFVDSEDKNWAKTIEREQLRRDGLANETDEPTSPGAKRFCRAVLRRAFNQIQYRGKQLRHNVDRAAKGADLSYVPAYEGELERLFDFLIALVNLEGFKVVEIQKPVKRQGGIDPKSLNLRPYESETDRARRAERMTWEQSVLADAFAAPDWSQPLAHDLSEEQRKLLVEWAEGVVRYEEERRQRQLAINSERPVPLRKKGR